MSAFLQGFQLPGVHFLYNSQKSLYIYISIYRSLYIYIYTYIHRYILYVFSLLHILRRAHTHSCRLSSQNVFFSECVRVSIAYAMPPPLRYLITLWTAFCFLPYVSASHKRTIASQKRLQKAIVFLNTVWTAFCLLPYF